MGTGMDRCTHRIPLKGAELVVETEGYGDALVLLHGFGADRRTWDDVATVLSRKHRVVRYDLRGFGASIETERVSFRHPEDLLVLLDTLGIPRCDLIGVSMGGSIALNFSLDYPDRVYRLVLMSPGLTGWEWSADWRAAWARIKEVASHHSIADARELWWNHPIFSTIRSHRSASASVRSAILRYSGQHWLYDNEEPACPDLDRLPLLSPSTLLLSGAQDLADFRLIADLIEAAAPRVTRIDVEGAGHHLHLESPEKIIDCIRTFLRP